MSRDTGFTDSCRVGELVRHLDPRVHVVCALILSLAAGTGNAQSTVALRDSSLVIAAPDLRIALPPHWLGGAPAPWVPPSHCAAQPAGLVRDRVVVEPERLRQLHSSRLEWRQELAIALRAALPRESLIAYAGGDPWYGACGAVQLRVYLLAGADSARDHTDATTRALRAEGYENRGTRERDRRGWQVERVRWSADRGDYVGIGTIEFWSRAIQQYTIVLVFHWLAGTDNDSMQTEREWIINSVRINPE